MQNSSDISVKFENVHLSFDDFVLFQELNFTIKKKEFVSIVGPSGCGKTSILNLIAGYLAPSEGAVTVNGNIRTVFQNSSLFPWLSVRENILIGKNKTKGNTEVYKYLLHKLKLEPFENFYPNQLSGGMRQKVELMRILVGETDIILLDEPFSALDYINRITIRNDFVNAMKELDKTIILITHDIDEAIEMSQRICVLNKKPTTIIDDIGLNKSYSGEAGQQQLHDLKYSIISKLTT
ncbi:ABC transporter ATP-binding protein [Gynurincola endophyticus]|uniref:ABC transporter ATP-binding protein n=1 Tax=Gynurincola endophyticus TaxID=2479004 RepID=UPI001315455A|nr:ATP-binding cassette domain-containing protein [Gynurincola endophyticus]